VSNARLSTFPYVIIGITVAAVALVLLSRFDSDRTKKDPVAIELPVKK